MCCRHVLDVSTCCNAHDVHMRYDYVELSYGCRDHASGIFGSDARAQHECIFLQPKAFYSICSCRRKGSSTGCERLATRWRVNLCDWSRRPRRQDNTTRRLLAPSATRQLPNSGTLFSSVRYWACIGVSSTPWMVRIRIYDTNILDW